MVAWKCKTQTAKQKVNTEEKTQTQKKKTQQINQNESDSFAPENKPALPSMLPHRCRIKIVIPVRICFSWLRALLCFVCTSVHKQHVI